MTWAMPVMANGYATPVISVSAITSTMAGRISRSMDNSPSGKVQGRDREIDRLDADERNDDASDTIDHEVPTQQRPGADRTVGDAFERERDQRDDDHALKMIAERIALCGVDSCMMFSAPSWG